MPITVTGAADQPGGPAGVVPTLHEISVEGRGGGLALPALDVPEAPLPEGLARAGQRFAGALGAGRGAPLSAPLSAQLRGG